MKPTTEQQRVEPAPPNDARVLVAYTPRPSDLERAETEGWYRIRSRRMANQLRGGIRSFSYVAFYQPKSFENEKYCVRRFAPIKAVSDVPRIELLPDDANHPRAHDLYCKLDLGPVRLLDNPVVCDRGRRILFVPTTWERLRQAEEFNDLFLGTPIEDRMYSSLRGLSGCGE